MEKELKKVVDKHDLNSNDNLLEFIKNNPEKLSIDSLARISELINTNRVETAAFYTDSNTLNTIENYLPNMNKDVIRILEPSVGVGNFLDIIIKKYSNADKLIIDVNDIDENSLLVMKSLNKYRNIPKNVEINYYNEDFITLSSKYHYDLVIGNPPFLKLSKKKGLNEYSALFDDKTTKNISGFFLQKSLEIADHVVLIQPKYFLHNKDFFLTRKRVNNHKIDYIIDFGEKGFKGVLIETIVIFIDVNEEKSETTVYSLTKNLLNVQKQEIITSGEFPSWIIYRDDFFNEIASKLKFFISENVRAFMNTKCVDYDVEKKIAQAFEDWLSDDYNYEYWIINFKDYGANSSRTRSLVLGVRKDIKNIIPQDLFPSEEKEKNLIDIIGYLPSLQEMGEIDPNDIYHNFRPYKENMREWIHDIGEGESAFDNKDENKRPHRIVNGKIVPNVRKNSSKYTRQYWNKVGPCIHTRNDILASQNTIHPVDDRVFSIRELMLLMNIPSDFKWVEEDESYLNSLPIEEKRKFLKKNEMNIRQCIGEAVPTIIVEKIARNIKEVLVNGKRIKKSSGQTRLEF